MISTATHPTSTIDIATRAQTRTQHIQVIEAMLGSPFAMVLDRAGRDALEYCLGELRRLAANDARAEHIRKAKEYDDD